MKQNDSYQDFDKQVQQLLGQASEPVPEGAWEAIAARLAAGAGAGAAGAGAAGAGAAGAAAGTGAARTKQSPVTPDLIGGPASAAAARKAVILKWVRRGGISVAAAAAAVLLTVLLWERPAEKNNDRLVDVHEQSIAAPEQGAVALEQAPVLPEAVEEGTVVPEQSAATPKQNAAAEQSVSVEQSAEEHSSVTPDMIGDPARAAAPKQIAAAPQSSATPKQSTKQMLAQNNVQSTAASQSTVAASEPNIAVPAPTEDVPQTGQNSPAPNTVTPNESESDQSTTAALGIMASTQSIIIASAEAQTVEGRAEAQTAEIQATAQPAEAQSATLAEAHPAEASAEPQPAETGVQPIDWDHLPDMEEEPQAKKHKKYQSNGFHLAAYTNALSNFTSKKSGQYTGYSGASGGNIPDHSYFKETGESSYTIPLTFGINFTYDVLPKLSVGLGVNYTRLSRHFSGTYYQLQDDGTFDAGTDYDNIYNIQQFIGIPLSVYYHIVRTKHINFYVYANGTVEKCIGNAWTANSRAVNYNEPVKGVQFNAGGGIGVDFILAPLVSIYLDPNIKYYFGLNQPKSIRTKQPFMLGFEAGVRFHL